MPGLAFDPAGHRVGYGGGFYDKFLAQEPEHPTLAPVLRLSALPCLETDPHDIPVDQVLWGTGTGGIGMKYIWLVLFWPPCLACAFLQTDALARCRRGLKGGQLCGSLCAIPPALRSPVAGRSGFRLVWRHRLFVAGAVLLAGISLYAAWTYHRTGIDYTSDCFTFRAGSQLKTFSFSQIQGQQVAISRRTVCLVLCTEEGNVVLYSNMQGFSAFLKPLIPIGAVKKVWIPRLQDWHNPADHRWFPDQPDETH